MTDWRVDWREGEGEQYILIPKKRERTDCKKDEREGQVRRPDDESPSKKELSPLETLSLFFYCLELELDDWSWVQDNRTHWSRENKERIRREQEESSHINRQRAQRRHWERRKKVRRRQERERERKNPELLALFLSSLTLLFVKKKKSREGDSGVEGNTSRINDLCYWLLHDLSLPLFFISFSRSCITVTVLLSLLRSMPHFSNSDRYVVTYISHFSCPVFSPLVLYESISFLPESAAGEGEKWSGCTSFSSFE